MPRETMTPRERWLAALTRQQPDRVPMDYRATSEATERLLAHLGLRDMGALLRRLHVDAPASVGPSYTGPPVAEGEDVFGCRYRRVDYGTGAYDECVYGPLAQYNSLAEIEANYTWPSPDWWDYSGIAQQLEGREDRPIMGGGSEPFLTYKYLRGQEQAFMDLALNPEIAHYCLGKLFGLAYENTRRIYEQIPGKVMLSYVAEDMGAQDRLMLSPAQIREFLLPRMKRVADLVHEGGGFVFHHNDGAIREIIPDLIEMGIDVLDPVQWRCKGMEREGLKRDFGGKLAFHGAMDNQYTLAWGSVAEVKQEVVDNIRILGEGGGYILGPCHNIQPVSPPENIVAMYDTGYECGWS
ncbi:MAG: uroporphyrinogen decarboxylase family protein [Armatimonadota bacterium]